MTQMPTPTLHVCTTCRAGQTLVDSDERPGRRMLDAVAAMLAPPAPAGDLQEVVCRSRCAPGMAADLLRYAETYAQSATGTVLPSRRPASLARVVLGRMPDLTQGRAA